MIRLIALSFGTVTMIGAVLWGLGDHSKTSELGQNEVSRAQPDALESAFNLQPALVQPATSVAPTSQTRPLGVALISETAPTQSPRPVARPVDLNPQAALPGAGTQPRPAPTQAEQAVTAMSYGIIGAFQAQANHMTDGAADAFPAQPAQQTSVAAQPAVVAEPVVVAAPAPPADTMRTYTVKEGDSLPGISFRFYGTTVAYLQILSENPDVLPDPADLRAGMTLRIPDLN